MRCAGRAITTRIDATDYFETVWRAILCHQSQLPGYGPLLELPPTSLGLVAARGAYSGACEDWPAALQAYLTANRDFLVAFICQELPGLHATVPHATYLGWLDCWEYVDAGLIRGSPFEFFLKEARVALTDGSTFGPGGEGCARINFATPSSVLAEALERVKRALG